MARPYVTSAGPAVGPGPRGDLVIVIAYAQMTPEEADEFEPQVVFVDRSNKVIEVGHDAGDVPDGYGLKTSAVTHRRHDH